MAGQINLKKKKPLKTTPERKLVVGYLTRERKNKIINLGSLEIFQMSPIKASE